MKSGISLTLLLALLFVLNGCGPRPSPTATFVARTPTSVPSTPTLQGKALIVTSAADSGPGTLRQALLDAQPGDTITFDATFFPSNDPVTIFLKDGLPEIRQGYLTIDSSNAGVILDGSHAGGSTTDGLYITSDGNTILGLQIINFPANGIALDGASRNRIGGDRSVGSGPLGQGNLLSNNGEGGIGLFHTGTSHNVIVGNYIGTDSNGVAPRGNQLAGIVIRRSIDNVIGPDNIIAYNQGNGVEITYEETYRNTITQNSIRDNDGVGISLQQGSNFFLAAPAILEFDLTTGTIAGIACSNCIVEIFSDSDDEGGIYEGRTSADGNGMFAFNKGSAFTGPHLTVSATDAYGNSGEFSLPTLGTSKSLRLQEGNNLPLTQFHSKRSGEIDNNRMGAMGRLDVYTEEHKDWLVDQNSDLGLKWMRLTKDWFDWWEVEDSGEYTELYIDPYQDQAIASLNSDNVKIMYTLVYWDEAIQAGAGYSRYKTEEEIQRYLDYVQFIVSHFKGQIAYYEILNEPNIAEGTQQYVKAADYINLVKRTVPVIRQEDPEAKIVAGAVTPLDVPAAHDYFFAMLNSDVMPMVDTVSWHGGDASSPEHLAEFYYDVPSLVQEIKDVAAAHGFKGEYFLEELHWRTPKDPHPTEYDEYKEVASAKYYGRGIVRCLGMDLTCGLALESLEELPLMVGVVRNLSTVMAGAEPESLPVEIQSEATNITSYSFSLPDGDKLIALWTDGVAVENDPGIATTLIVPDISAQRVVDIDVLYGVEQQLITDSSDGNLVIRDLLVKDYPIILRLTDVTSP